MRKIQLYLAAVMAVVLTGGVHAQEAPQDVPKAKLVEAVSTMESTCGYRQALRGEEWVELWILPVEKGTKSKIEIPGT